MINGNFVATLERVSTFSAAATKTKTRKDKESTIKQGGDLITYFCTPDEEILYFVNGPVNANTFMDLAQWSLDTMTELSKVSGQQERIRVMKERYAQIAKRDITRAKYIHDYTFALDPPLRKLEELEQILFEQFTNNRFERRNFRNDDLLNSFKAFQNDKKLILLVITPRIDSLSSDLDDSGEYCRLKASAAATEAVSKYTEHVGVLELTDGELTILLDDLDMKLPTGSFDRRSPTAGFLIFNAQGKQLLKLKLDTKASALAECVRRRLYLPSSKTNPEVLAKDKLAVARRLLTQNPPAAKKWLQQAIEMYPNTAAAQEAQILLASLN